MSDTSLHRPADRERTATRLLRSSAKHSFDPVVEIDWEAPLAEGQYFAPPYRSSLYGTDLWERLSEQERIELTKHEVASIASVGIWFETILMQMLIRHAYDRDPTTGHVQYTYTEVGDECRHSVMFAKMIEKFGCPAYGTGRTTHALGRIFKTISNGPLTFGGTLYVEAILDELQRESMADESLQPLVRAVSRIHVVEEARHMSFAKDENARQWTPRSRLDRAYTRIMLALVAYFATTQLVHPQAYAAVGLDPRQARKVARRNPHWRRTCAWAARKAVAYFDELDMIGGPGRLLWRRAGLID